MSGARALLDSGWVTNEESAPLDHDVLVLGSWASNATSASTTRL